MKQIHEVSYLYNLSERLSGTELAYFLLGLLNRIEGLEELLIKADIFNEGD